MLQGDKLVVSEEVEHALESGSAGVVALETAIVTHGQLTLPVRKTLELY